MSRLEALRDTVREAIGSPGLLVNVNLDNDICAGVEILAVHVYRNVSPDVMPERITLLLDPDATDIAQEAKCSFAEARTRCGW